MPSAQVDLTVKDFDTLEYIRDNKGTSLEMACRELRYAWFRETAAEIGADRIATGHNADDNIETMLLNLFRGQALPDCEACRPTTERSGVRFYLCTARR